MKTVMHKETCPRILSVVPKFYSMYHVHAVIDKNLNHYCLFSDNACGKLMTIDLNPWQLNTLWILLNLRKSSYFSSSLRYL